MRGRVYVRRAGSLRDALLSPSCSGVLSKIIETAGEERGERTAESGQRTVDRGQRAEGRGQRTEETNERT